MAQGRINKQGIQQQYTRLPLIGKIRIGQKNERGLPTSLDYFIATGSYSSKFNEVYPAKPSKIQVVFISDDNLQSCAEEWDGRDSKGRKAGYGDGETYHLYDAAKGEYIPTTDLEVVRKYSKQHVVKWKQVLTINFIIPAIKGVFGVWQLQTSGDKSSIRAIRNTFDEIKELAGTVINIPFDLCVKKVTSNKPDSTSVYPVLTLVPNISAENMEVLRGFLQAGLDVKRQGMLTDSKLETMEHAKALPSAAHKDVFTEAERVKTVHDVINALKESGKTVLDAAAVTAGIKDKDARINSIVVELRSAKDKEAAMAVYVKYGVEFDNTPVLQEALHNRLMQLGETL